ncbi:MAG: Tyrosine-specific transport protein [Chlamydiia bacterium]|nr:Tyrosine-specific transport protein [Chlamydiia bacterium]
MTSALEETKTGSIFGGMLLISGSCIGAGMLGLPILTGVAGFLPTLIMFFAAWLFMTLTGLLLVEVSTWFHTPVNLLSMVDKTLGKTGRICGWILYLFLFYALGVAYLSSSANHTNYFFNHVLMLNIPVWFSSVFFVIVFGWLIYLGTRPVDLFNRGLMFAKIVVFACLLILGANFVKSKLLLYTDFKYSLFSLPILIISFGFHNMIPSLYSYLGGDVKRIKSSILAGSLLTLLVYVLWEIIALGILTVNGPNGILESYHNDIGAAQALRNVLGSNSLGIFAQLLAFFAILTSFIAQSLSLVHFLGDGLKVKKKKRENVWLCLLALGPPLLFSIIFPQLFFAAINFAGGVCAVILFGVLPVLMVWIGRYRHKIPSNYKIMGGQPLLVCIMLFALFVVVYQVTNMFGLNLFPIPKV